MLDLCRQIDLNLALQPLFLADLKADKKKGKDGKVDDGEKERERARERERVSTCNVAASQPQALGLISEKALNSRLSCQTLMVLPYVERLAIFVRALELAGWSQRVQRAAELACQGEATMICGSWKYRTWGMICDCARLVGSFSEGMGPCF